MKEETYITKKILILGGAGFVGEAITEVCSFDSKLYIYDNLMFEDRYMKTFGQCNNIDFIYGDVTDYEKLKRTIDKIKPDSIIALAGTVGDGCAATNPEYTQKVNIESLKWLRENYDGRIVFTSSCSVYGKADHILSEEMELNPLSLYAETKVEGEKILENSNAVIFRLGTLYGLAGKFSRPRFDLVGNLLAVKAALNEPITVFSGNQWRPMLHVKDAAKAIYEAAINDEIPCDIYNLNHKNMNLKTMAQEIVDAAKEEGLNPDLVFSEIPLEDQRNYRVTNDKFYSLGFVEYPKRTIKDSAKEIISLIKQGRIKNPKDALYHNHRWMQENMPGETIGKSSVN
jgi:nucleoside-diphosphate-sugar epimerase